LAALLVGARHVVAHELGGGTAVVGLGADRLRDLRRGRFDGRAHLLFDAPAAEERRGDETRDRQNTLDFAHGGDLMQSRGLPADPRKRGAKGRPPCQSSRRDVKASTPRVSLKVPPQSRPPPPPAARSGSVRGTPSWSTTVLASVAGTRGPGVMMPARFSGSQAERRTTSPRLGSRRTARRASTASGAAN